MPDVTDAPASKFSEPYVRIWFEQPSNVEVAMLTAADYRRLCADLARVAAQNDGLRIAFDECIASHKRQAEEIAALKKRIRIDNILVYGQSRGNYQWCRLCTSEWTTGEGEQHKADCLARLDVAPTEVLPR